LDAGGDVHGVADHRVLHAGLPARVAGDDLAGVDADPGAHPLDAARLPPSGEPALLPLARERFERLLHGNPAAHRRRRMPFERLGRVEDCEDRAAEQLEDAASVLLDDVGHRAEVSLEHRHQLSRLERGAEGGESWDIDEEHRNLALLATEPVGVGARERAPSNLLADVAAEDPAQSLPLLEVAHHPIEAPPQNPELVFPLEPDPRREIAARHRLARLDDARDRPAEASPE